MDGIAPSLPTLLVLRALEDSPSHGYRIARWIEEQSENMLTLREGTLYPLLHQLEKEGLIHGQWQTEGTDRPSKVYELTDSGHVLLDQERQAWNQRAAAISKVLSNSPGVNHGLA